MREGVQTRAEFRQSYAMLSDICVVCHRPIHVMCRKYTGICSENCQKAAATIKETPSATA